MIHTLCTSGYLYKVNRHREQYQDSIDKRKAFWLSFWITVCITIATMIFVIYR